LSALLVAPLLAGCSSNSTAAKDVTIGSCTADPSGGRPTAEGTIVNNSSKASTYLVDINFFDSSGNKVSEGGATIGKVESAATANFHAQGLQSAKGPLTCKLATVKRTIAP
jgi:hypothetical protein